MLVTVKFFYNLAYIEKSLYASIMHCFINTMEPDPERSGDPLIEDSTLQWNLSIMDRAK